MEYITIKDGKISGHFNGDTLPEGAIKVANFAGFEGEPVTFYNQKTWERYTEKELILKGLVEVPKGYRITKDKKDLEEISDEEKVAQGLISQLRLDMSILEKDEQYLSSTDWYIIRAKEIDKEVPADVLEERQRCRDEISELRARKYDDEGNLLKG